MYLIEIVDDEFKSINIKFRYYTDAIVLFNFLKYFIADLYNQHNDKIVSSVSLYIDSNGELELFDNEVWKNQYEY